MDRNVAQCYHFEFKDCESILIEAGAPVNSYRGTHVTSYRTTEKLIIAAASGLVEWLNSLIQAGVDVKRTVMEKTALSLAVMNGYLECVKLLLKAGEPNALLAVLVNLGYNLKNGKKNVKFIFLIEVS